MLQWCLDLFHDTIIIWGLNNKDPAGSIVQQLLILFFFFFFYQVIHNVVPIVITLYTLPKNYHMVLIVIDMDLLGLVILAIFCHNHLPVTLRWWHLLILSSPHAPVCRRVTMRFGKSGSSISPAGPITAFPATPQACWASSARSSSSILQTQDPSWYTAGVLLSKPLLHLFLWSLSHSS